MSVYYNEHDGFKAAWLRELIRAGAIADGEVDKRSIKDVEPGDLVGFTQCHFFAGIGVWSYALRLAGWPDDRPVWTGSCPCPSFSAAGKGRGFNDPRHLWPDWFRLIRERRPANLFGEQADDAIGFGWLDLVQTDLEAADYAVGKAVFGACSVGAPHIRQRLYFGAHANGAELFGIAPAGHESPDRHNGKAVGESVAVRATDGGSNSEHAERRTLNIDQQNGFDGSHGGRAQAHGESGTRGEVCSSADAERRRREQRDAGQWPVSESHAHGADDSRSDSEYAGLQERERERGTPSETGNADTREAPERNDAPTNGHWRDAIWLPCGDGKYRPTQPGLSPLAHGAPARVGRLRGYGDAIVAQQAQAFIEAFKSSVDSQLDVHFG